MAPMRTSRRSLLAAPLLLASLTAPVRLAQAATRGDADFDAFLASVQRQALSQGMRPAAVAAALRQTQYLPHVIALDHRQPEMTMSFAEYLDKVVTPTRIAAARRHLAQNWRLLDSVARRFDVDPAVIVALWAVETNFGKITGGYQVVSSLATLGYEGRRSAYFRHELLAALRIISDGDVRPASMLGSWAGAMGQCQFMPSTFLHYAVDYDGTGRRNIWTDRADVFASIANFISRLGWRAGRSWGREVVLPAGFNTGLSGLGTRQTVGAWERLGVRSADGRPLPQDGEASLVMPDGAGGAAYLVFKNFRAVMGWNRSTYFATAVGYLVDSMGRA